MDMENIRHTAIFEGHRMDATARTLSGGKMMGYVVVLLAGILTGMLITVLAAVGYVCHKGNTNDTHMDESDKR